LPVDAYFPRHQLVVEYHERQHSEAVAFFDKPEVMTVSGVPRRKQRARYDKRRAVEIPRHGVRLLVVASGQLSSNRRRRLHRDAERDRRALGAVLRAARVL
jgi:hypothetical protein